MRGETVRIERADEKGVAQAAALLAAGGIAAIPTETVYGLAADAANGAAVAAVYAAKGRPAFNPLIVHVADRAMAGRYARFDALAEALAARFWPGPLTLVLPMVADAPLASLVTAGLPTVALRVPARVGLESSIVAVADGKAVLLRQGGLAAETIAEVAGPLAVAADDAPVSAPGMLLRHYAPRLPLHMDVAEPPAGWWHIGFGAIAGDENLSATGDAAEAAANLFAALHRAGDSGRTAIAVAPIPADGLGAAINDRLRRAAEV